MGGHQPVERWDQASDADGGRRSVAALVESLQPLDQTRAELLCRAAHDLRTPLTAISGFVELLADGEAGPVTDTQREILRTVTRSADRMMRLVDALEPPTQDGR